ncbi:mRNA decapping complex subunit 2 [Fusarium subglutinans]|uniref:mRNA decapping complex subunit 2 n=1 Tax=Gibberella subglutinans TaxID=42677 RepID=A0A8H5NVC4_GIBSU|nr:mRNA decapping complex subunit 2 [Fusarium subglutinans]KAF5578303.1 mRNA decapping complex subunit 2 [Fusarium subglutinans]
MSGSQMQLEDWLDDLCVRFIINLPQEDLSSVARICFQVEEAQWFYEDFIRPLDPTLPSMTLRTFCLRIFQHCPLLANFSVENHTKAFEEFLEYKTRVPVRGAIMLNEAMDSTVLVKGWKKGANWSFPRGKINKDEDDLDCAVREVYEETGLDLRAAGLVPTEHKPKYIEISMREQHMRLYVFRDVPMDTVFEPKTRKEISKIQWYKLSELPAFRRKNGQANDANTAPNANKFYMVAPFLVPLKKWVMAQKKIEARRAANSSQGYGPISEAQYEDEAWNDTGAETTDQGPAIETLAGATQELQRLLKVQPPTQGLQGVSAPAPAPQDKGSALLSILQAKGGPTSAMPPPAGAHYPQTPLDHTVTNAPEPHTPHHHNIHQMPSTNTQQPPPPFPYAPNQGAHWGMGLGQQAGNPQLYNQQYSIQEGQYKSNQAPLVHPQPLPPQVERAVFNRSVFQDVNQPTHNPVPGQFLTQQQAQYGYHGQMPQQSLNGPGQPRPQPMNGQSMALLNAFKGGNTAPQVQQKPQQVPFPPGFPAQSQGSVYSNLGGAQAQRIPQQVPHAAGPVGGQDRSGPSPKELPGSKVGPPPDNHRSALLGMFRKDDQNQPPAQGPQPAGQPAPGGMMSELLRSVGGDNFRANIPQQAPVDPNPLPSMDGLSLQQRPTQNGTPGSQGRADYSQQYGIQAHAPAASQPTQPIRILQRGQGEQLFGINGASASPQTSLASPSGMSSHLQPAGAGISPSIAQAFPAMNRRRESGPAQKRELLSLFGKQPSPASLEAAKGKEVIAGTPRSRLASLASGADDPAGPPSRRGSQTPISPAERTFLLDYLQSVTKNANH